jgi:protein-S-isoprenylcysteine O-methyltransferase Ste14
MTNDASNTDDGASVWIPPPLIYLAGVIGGALLHAYVRPMPLLLEFGPRLAVSLTFVMLGIALMAGAVGLFKRTGQDPKPWKSTPEIISTGVYRFTRNPMYLGLALLQIGIGVGLENGWVLALVPPVLLAIYQTTIRHEEAYLEDKFGDIYLQYKHSVRRWL